MRESKTGSRRIRPGASVVELQTRGASWGMSRNGVKNYSKRARWSRNR